jgi:Coenzyme PQQ synthesis protein D (PqqD)
MLADAHRGVSWRRGGDREWRVEMGQAQVEQYLVGSAVVFRELDGEAVLLNLDSGVYFGLDEVGTRVWALLVEHGTLERVCSQLMEEYDVEPAVLEQDVSRLVEELCHKGLVVAASENRATP